MASPVNIREVRFVSGTTFNTAHTAADNAAWAPGTATKLRVLTSDASGLVYASEEDATLEQRLFAGRSPIPTLRNGQFSFATYLEGAYTNITANPVATLLSKIMGGVASPATARTDTVEAASSTTSLNLAAHGVSTGTAVLVGSRGGGGGNAEVRVGTASDVNTFDLTMALPADPSTETLTYSTTVYNHDTTQNYLDFLAIGDSAEDQIQTIGGMGTFSFANISPGEVPRIEFEIMVGDWQEVPSGERDQLEPTSAVQGNQPAIDRGLGGFFLGDNGSTTRTAFKVADVSINPGISYEAIPDPNGINGIGGWRRVRGQPTVEFTALLEGGADPLPGFYDDFAAGTAKQLLIQFGDSNPAAAYDMPYCFFQSAPVRAEAGQLAGVKCVLVGHSPPTQDTDTQATALQYSAQRIHFF